MGLPGVSRFDARMDEYFRVSRMRQRALVLSIRTYLRRAMVRHNKRAEDSDGSLLMCNEEQAILAEAISQGARYPQNLVYAFRAARALGTLGQQTPVEFVRACKNGEDSYTLFEGQDERP